ncbi:MAG TPA: efflux RND transporter periplasmic adaptor subunit [Dongiaceae bacterium]|jgi:multidrug efflux system membrane fusion protein
MKTSYYIAAGVALLAAAWVVSGQFHDAPATAAADAGSAPAAGDQAALPTVRVRAQTAQPRAVEVILRGRTEAVRKVDVRAETKGKVTEVLAEKGSVVEEGALLVRLADDDRQARLRQTKALLTQREIEYAAAAKLSKQGFKSETEAADAMAKLEEAKALVASMEIDIGYTAIHAPFGGVVEQRPVEIGDFVNIGDPVATIVDLDPILVIGQVTEQDVARLKVGLPGTARLINGDRLTGKIRYIGATADEDTRTFRVELEIPNADRHIVQGLSTELRLPVADMPAHRVSPAILTLADNGDIGVKTVNADNIVEFHPVTIVGDGPDGLWLAGLPENVTVITVGQEFVQPGQKVNPVPESGAAGS